MDHTEPAAYLGTPVPDSIRSLWKRWEGAEWRQNCHRAANETYPPDERFNVRPPAGMCEHHRQAWRDYRNMRFDYETGARWPGHPGSPFLYVGTDMKALREERRVEWDRKASAQMQLIEEICQSRRSCRRLAEAGQ